MTPEMVMTIAERALVITKDGHVAPQLFGPVVGERTPWLLQERHDVPDPHVDQHPGVG